MNSLLVTGGRVIDPAHGLDAVADLLAIDGKVVVIGLEAAAKAPADCPRLDAAGRVVCPGLIDIHVHLRDPGQTAKESIATGTAMLSPKARYYAKKVQKMDFSKADRINDDVFNRYIWHSIKGDARYPSEFVGGHGKGLKKLGLVLAKAKKDDDD